MNLEANLNAHIKFTMEIEQEDEQSTTSYETLGRFYEEAHGYFLFFDEKSDQDTEVTKCRFELSGDKLRLRRVGPITVEQSHSEKKQTTGYIKTPFGRMATTIQTNILSFNRLATGFYRLNLHYDLYIQGEKTGTYQLKITVTQKEEHVS